MALVQFAYLAEIVAAITVVASLIYVAQQLRQNTEAIKFGAVNTLVETTRHLAGDIVADREVAEYWVKAADDFAGLDDVDKTRAIMFEFRAIQAWSHWFHLRQNGHMPDAQWTELVWLWENFGGARQSVREAWKEFKGAYPQEFQDFMAQYLEGETTSRESRLYS